MGISPYQKMGSHSDTISSIS